MAKSDWLYVLKHVDGKALTIQTYMRPYYLLLEQLGNLGQSGLGIGKELRVRLCFPYSETSDFSPLSNQHRK